VCELRSSASRTSHQPYTDSRSPIAAVRHLYGCANASSSAAISGRPARRPAAELRQSFFALVGTQPLSSESMRRRDRLSSCQCRSPNLFKSRPRYCARSSPPSSLPRKIRRLASNPGASHVRVKQGVAASAIGFVHQHRSRERPGQILRSPPLAEAFPAGSTPGGRWKRRSRSVSEVLCLAAFRKKLQL